MAWGVAPEAQRPVLGAGASTSGDPGLPPEEAAVRLLRDLLAAFFQAYLEDASEVRKPQMSLLLAQAHQHGLVGARVLPALAALHDALRPGSMPGPRSSPPSTTSSSSSRASGGDRNLRAEAATNAWAFALANGRFTLLERFCAFVKNRSLPRGVSEDTWCQVLRLRGRRRRAFASPEDAVAAYDPRGAWPVLVDEFVDHLRGGVSVPNESQSFSSQSLSQSSPQSEERGGGSRACAAASRPRRRRFVDRPDRVGALGGGRAARASRARRCTRAGARAGRGGHRVGRRAGPNGGEGSLDRASVAAANPASASSPSPGGAARPPRRSTGAHLPSRGCGRGVQAPPSARCWRWRLATQLERQARVESAARRGRAGPVASTSTAGMRAAPSRRAEPGRVGRRLLVRARRRARRAS